MNTKVIHDEAEARKLLADYLRLLRDTTQLNIRNYQAKNPSYEVHYYGIGDFLLQHGQWFTPRPLPAPFHVGTPRACFQNAALFALKRKLRYIEGYALKIIPVHHAWVADKKDNIFEVTWNEPGVAYLGVEFNPFDTENGSILDNPIDHSIYHQPWKGK